MTVAALRAGALYFALVFAIGFVLGTIRTLFLVTRTGELLAVVIELPIILAAAWAASRYVCRRLGVSPESAARLAMGLCALALLLLAEWLLSVSLAGRTTAAHFAHYFTLPGALGLAGQCAFAAFPWMQGIAATRSAPLEP